MRDPELIALIAKTLREVEGLGQVVILTHVGGDPDSIASAYVLRELLLKKLKVKLVDVVVPEEPTAHIKPILTYLSLNVLEDVPKDAEAYFVVDAGSPEQLGRHIDILSILDRFVIVLDHHSGTVNKYPKHVKVFSNELYQSVSEIMYDLVEYIGYSIGLREAEALFIGIYYDTARLMIADEESTRKLCKLISIGINPSSILSSLEHGLDISERIARLKAAMRMKVYRFEEWVFAFTEVSAFQSSVARALISLGAHIAIAVGGREEGILSASIRAVNDLCEKTGLNVGVDLAEKVAGKFNGYGGGHACAAHFTCKASIEDVLNTVLEILSTKLKKNLEVVKP
ncbi:MAG: DHH family phosphoesterase [Nitrososphaerota archaeon]|nr:DHH family phosphoesterase [Candidatus Geocrenenecus dongiae]